MSCPARAAAGHDDDRHFFLMVSTTWVDLRCVAFLTVVKRPVLALRPTLNVLDFMFRTFTFALRVGGALAAPPVHLGGGYSGIRIGHARSPNAFA